MYDVYAIDSPHGMCFPTMVMAIRDQRHANVSKQTTLLDGVDVGPLKWRVCGHALNQCVHEGMNYISNVKVHLRTST